MKVDRRSDKFRDEINFELTSRAFPSRHHMARDKRDWRLVIGPNAEEFLVLNGHSSPAIGRQLPTLKFVLQTAVAPLGVGIQR
jgi:hypothetical protein